MAVWSFSAAGSLSVAKQGARGGELSVLLLGQRGRSSWVPVLVK